MNEAAFLKKHLSKTEQAELIGINQETEQETEDNQFIDIVPWPDDLAPEALHGLAGEVVGTISPYSEADDSALLINFLVAFGNVIGNGPHFKAGPDKHRLNLFAALVGESAKGRKGMSWGWVREIFKIIDEEWAIHKTPGGLSTGEGLIWQVRDEIIKREPIKENGKTVDYEEVVIDQGVKDKRLLVIEGEFASALKIATRHGNTLSPLIRLAWDTGNISSMTKNSPARATDALISIIGHITKTELIQTLTENDQANGFANRFLWMCVRRSKYLPDGDPLPASDLNRIASKVNEAVQFAKGVKEMKRDADAAELWRKSYPNLSEGKPGLLGSVLGRAEAQVMRLSCMYALLDQSPLIQVEHLAAAMALWERCEHSARFIFGDKEGDPVADTILDALRSGPLSQSEISSLFSRHCTASQLKAALQALSAKGKIIKFEEKTGGRPKALWKLARAKS